MFGRRRADGLAVIAIAAAVALVLGRSVSGGFLAWDDDRFFVKNPLWHGPVLSYVWAAVSRVQFEAYQPLHLLSYLPDRLLWAGDARGFRALDLIWFAADVGLLYALARRRAGVIPALVAALAFALHPLCVEPAAWITSRKDLVGLTFFALALLDLDRGRGRRAVLWGALAVLAKTSTMCLPLVALAWLRWMNGLAWRDALRRAAPLVPAPLVAAIAVHGFWAKHGLILPSRPEAAPLDVLATLGTYGARVVAPVHLSPIYPTEAPVPWWAFVVAVAIVAAAWRWLPAAARFACVAFVCALAPVANVVPLYFRFADRYAFLALAVLVPPLALVARAWMAPLLVAPAIVSFGLAGAWRDSDRLSARAALAQPTAYLAHMKRAEVLRDAGRFDEAIAEGQTMVALAPDDLKGYATIFYTYARRAAPDRADEWLARLGPALADERAAAELERDVADCHRCSLTLLLLELKARPLPDEELRRRADAEPDPARAAVFRSQLR